MTRAVISDCGRYRYALSRDIGPDPDHGRRRATVSWVMVNPSTADADTDDPTIRRVIGFTHAWGYERATVANLFAYRATDPLDMISAATAGIDVVGPDNDAWMATDLMLADLVVVAWGASVDLLRRRGPLVDEQVDKVRRVLGDLGKTAICLGRTASSEPRHPLMLPKTTTPHPYHLP